MVVVVLVLSAGYIKAKTSLAIIGIEHIMLNSSEI
jgi:hypothetical protein